MGTVLRWLVCVILVLGIGALALAVLLFGKRELLIGRTHLLETQMIKVAKTLESADPGDSVQPRYTAKDISPVTSKELENPERSDFWDKYQYKLEPANPALPLLDLDNDQKKLQLRQYYQIGPDGKPVLDALTGKKSTKGGGTMQALLDEVLDRAQKQQATLNKTRAELAKVRDELNKTIDDFNGLKKDGRADKKTIEDKQAEIDKLKEEAQALKRKIDGLEEEKRALTAEVAEAKTEITKQKEQIDDLSKQVADLNKKIKDLIKPENKIPNGGGNVPVAELFLSKIAPGDKGKIVAADNNLKYVVAELSDAFMTELLGPNRDGALPQIDLMVRRTGLKGSSGDFVTRIRLRQVLRQQNLVVADILIDWQQVPVDKNDTVFF